MSYKYKIGIVAAMEREVRPLVRNWHSIEHEHLGRTYRFFENGAAVVVCAGIGPEAARRATEALIELFRPQEILSVGFAGALNSDLKVGDVFTPSRMVDVKDGSRVETGIGCGVLLSLGLVADPEQKARLAEAYGAQAVDMEAAAVARGAQAHGIGFSAIKAISDECSFAMPPVERFVASDGQFRTAAFVGFVALRPWLWRNVVRLSGNNRRASGALCRELSRYCHEQLDQEMKGETAKSQETKVKESQSELFSSLKVHN